MTSLLLKVFLPPYIRIKWWLAMRKVQDAQTFEIPMSNLVGDVYLVKMSGSLVKVFTWVELNLMYGTQWSDEHLFAFYDSVISLVGMGVIDETRLLMHLHPEAYMTSEEFVGEPEPEVELLLDSGKTILMLPAGPDEIEKLIDEAWVEKHWVDPPTEEAA